jgi:hypothetical protein
MKKSELQKQTKAQLINIAIGLVERKGKDVEIFILQDLTKKDLIDLILSYTKSVSTKPVEAEVQPIENTELHDVWATSKNYSKCQIAIFDSYRNTKYKNETKGEMLHRLWLGAGNYQLCLPPAKTEADAKAQPIKINLKKARTRELKNQVLAILGFAEARQVANWAKKQGMQIDLCYKEHWALVLEKLQSEQAA